MEEKKYLNVGGAWDTEEKGKKFISVKIDGMKGEEQNFRLYENAFKKDEKNEEKKKHLPDFVLMTTHEKAAILGLDSSGKEDHLANIGGGWVKETKDRKGTMIKVIMKSGAVRHDINLISNAFKKEDKQADYYITASEDDAKALGLKGKVIEAKKKLNSSSLSK